jgi:hypothetical protein
MVKQTLLRSSLVVAALAIGCVGSIAAHADDRRNSGDRRAPPAAYRPRGFDHQDNRYNHNRYYPSRGYVAAALPRERYPVYWRGGSHYYYSGGVWYAPRGPRYVVVGAPIGAFVPVLPGFYTTLWIGGSPYYYANDTYYVYHEPDRQYEVVAPPDDRDARVDGPPGAPPKEDVFTYPKNGQSEAQQATDKYECHKWASGESGFDPTASGGGVPADQNPSKRADYNRAMTACLEGRGYSVK